jgi:hypothetical protein
VHCRRVIGIQRLHITHRSVLVFPLNMLKMSVKGYVTASGFQDEKACFQVVPALSFLFQDKEQQQLVTLKPGEVWTCPICGVTLDNQRNGTLSMNDECIHLAYFRNETLLK